MNLARNVLVLTFAFVPFCGRAQAFFQDLNFESATLIPIAGDPYGSVDFAPAFPGWTGYVGGVQETSALYDNEFLDSSGIGIHDQWSSFGARIEGSFTAVLQAGISLFTGTPADTTLSQTGLVPPGTQSLLFKAQLNFGSETLAVTLGGQPLTLIPLQDNSNYILYGADIHTQAGRRAQLSFTVLAENPHVNNNTVYLDSIQFSPQPVPEPNELGLCVLGLLIFGWRILSKGR